MKIGSIPSILRDMALLWGRVLTFFGNRLEMLVDLASTCQASDDYHPGGL